MPEQESLALEAPKAPPSKFVIPDDPEVVAPSGKETPATPAPETKAEEPKAPNKEEAATSADPEAKPDKELTPEQLAAKRDRRAQNKLEKAYRVRAEALAKADLLEKRLAELEAKSSPQQTQPGEPKLQDFDYDPEKYAAAKAEFAKTQAAKEYETKQRTEAQKQAHQRLISGWEEKVAKAEEKYDDWQEVVGDIQPTAPFVAAFMEAENGEDIAHYLGKHPKEAQRIAELPPLSQVREIGKLEAKLSVKPAEPKAPSKAPAPITPLAGTAAANTNEPSETDSYADWFKKRQKQVHGKR